MRVQEEIPEKSAISILSMPMPIRKISWQRARGEEFSYRSESIFWFEPMSCFHVEEIVYPEQIPQRDDLLGVRDDDSIGKFCVTVETAPSFAEPFPKSKPARIF